MTTRNLPIKASKAAIKAHEGQMYGNVPYWMHCLEVYMTMTSLGITDPNVLAAGWLHDTLEDTKLTGPEIEKQFGPTVATLVALVTDKSGKSRKERHQATYPGIAQNIGACYVKLCDRIANVRNCLETGNTKLFNMYYKERDEFEHYLTKKYKKETLFYYWETLDKLYAEGSE